MKLNTMLKLLATASTALALNAFTAFAADTVQVDKGGDITPICGTKPTKIALIDGYGSDTWRKITQAELRDEASIHRRWWRSASLQRCYQWLCSSRF
jgi:ribose transport system substrate-binding protein